MQQFPCSQCGYEMEGLAHVVCPECGAVQTSVVQPYIRPEQSRKMSELGIAAVVCMLGAMIVSVAPVSSGFVAILLGVGLVASLAGIIEAAATQRTSVRLPVAGVLMFIATLGFLVVKSIVL